MYHTLEEAEEAAKSYAAKHMEKIELRKEVVAPSDILFVYEPENADECLGHYFFLICAVLINLCIKEKERYQNGRLKFSVVKKAVQPYKNGCTAF